MRWGKTYIEEAQLQDRWLRANQKPKRWFAWHPVVIQGRWVWLETVICYWYGSFCGGWWIYENAPEHYS